MWKRETDYEAVTNQNRSATHFSVMSHQFRIAEYCEEI